MGQSAAPMLKRQSRVSVSCILAGIKTYDKSNSLTWKAYFHTMKLVRFMRDGSTVVQSGWVAPNRFFIYPFYDEN